MKTDKKNAKRIIEDRIEKSLSRIGAINLIGPKGCGKTYIAEKFCNSFYYLKTQELWNDDLYRLNKNIILDGKKPRLIDEWQLVPKIWDSVRFWVDQKNERGLFILTSSVNVNRETISHSGAGRMLQVEMNTLTMYESNDSSGLVSIKSLFDGDKINEHVATTGIKEIANVMCRGGWPSVVFNDNSDIESSNDLLESYIDSIVNFENYNEFKNKSEKSSSNTLMILKSLARNVATQLKNATVLSDINNEISRNTIPEYLCYLKNIFVINELNVWLTNNYRSKTRLLTTPKTYFCDPSIGLKLLNINPNNIFNDMNTFGLFFENLVIRDLKVYAQANGGKLYFYRDINNFEIDAIIELNDGRWAAFEIKLGDSKFDEAAKNLLNFKNKKNANNQPAFLAIITVVPFCYQRDDGVYIIPIQSLKD